MTSEVDVWRAAHLLIKQQGDDGGGVAVRRAGELLAAGDALGHETFTRIAKAVDELRKEKPESGEPVH